MFKAPSQPLLAPVPLGAGLPPYTYQSQGPGPYYHTVPLTVRIEVEPRYRRSPLRRFLCAFVVALGIYAALRAVVVHHRYRGYWPPWEDHWDTPANLAFEHCVSGGSASAESPRDAAFEIPLNSDTVLLVSRYRSSSWGSSLSGSLDITTSTHLNDTAKIVVRSLRSRDVTACMVRGDDGEAGVAVFSKGSWMGHGAAKSVKISVVLPRAEKPLQLKGIVAELPNFSLNIGNLTGAVEFRSATFRTSNAAVKVESLTAGHAKLHTSNALINAHSLFSSDLTLETSNGAITGTFNTSDSLHMTTSNAPISVTVGLENSNTTRPTTLLMRTSNNRLDAKVHLATTNARKNGGAFRVTGTTSNGRLILSLPTAPLSSALDLSARTSNAAAEVRLPPAYQGSFRVSTSAHFTPSVTRVDESGGDGRQIEYRGVRGREVSGYVYEKERDKELGRVVLTTSNAPAELFV